MQHTPELVSWIPAGESHPPREPAAAALILPGGFVRGRGRYWAFVDHQLRNLAGLLATHDGLAVYLLRYRHRGWNGERADAAVDARWALTDLEARHGGVPVALIGNSMGGRAAVRVAGHRTVSAIVGIAPWLPDGEPVEPLAGRKVLILHGDRDRSGAGHKRSLAYAEQARSIVPDLARLEVKGSRHYLIARERDCWAAITNFVVGVLRGRPLAPTLAAAMAAPAPNGLRLALPPGFTDDS